MLCSINTSVALLQIRYVRIRINLPDPIQIIVIRSSAMVQDELFFVYMFLNVCI